MLKKLKFFIYTILLVSIVPINIYATNLDTNINNYNNSYTDTYTTSPTSGSNVSRTSVTNNSSLAESNLGLNNILSILLIVIGILLVLLGIAVLIRLKN